jgi:hypothetical protein
MRLFVVLLLAAMLSACIPIGIRGTTTPLRSSANEIPSVRAAHGAA